MSHVYIFRSGIENLFKVGRTRQVIEARNKQLSTGNPYPLTLFDSIETQHDALCEKYLHNVMQTKRYSSGTAREFFAVTPAEMQAYVQEARKFIAELTSVLPEIE